MPPKKSTKKKSHKTCAPAQDAAVVNGLITDVRHFPTPFPPDLPPFDKENIELWFNRVEVIFASNYIHREDLQCAFVLAALDKTTMTKIRHRQEDSETPYTDLKNGLTRLYTRRTNAKMDKLLKKTRLGLSKPSIFFNIVHASFGTSASEFFLTGLFLESLPSKIRSELPLREKSLKSLVAIADQLYDKMTEDAAASAAAAETVSESPQPSEADFSDLVDQFLVRPSPHRMP